MSLLMKGVGEAGGFSPASIAGLQAWYDASDAASFTFSSGSIVSQWNDKSGNARHLAQGTVANQPDRGLVTINGRPAVKFDGINDTMTTALTLAQAFTVIGVIFLSSIPGVQQWLLDAGTVGGVMQMGANYGIFSGSSIGGGVTDTATPHIHEGVFNGASSQVFLDGASVASGNAGANGYAGTLVMSRSGAAQFSGSVGEAVIYNSALSVTDRQTLEAYLKAKWGTP